MLRYGTTDRSDDAELELLVGEEDGEDDNEEYPPMSINSPVSVKEIIVEVKKERKPGRRSLDIKGKNKLKRSSSCHSLGSSRRENFEDSENEMEEKRGIEPIHLSPPEYDNHHDNHHFVLMDSKVINNYFSVGIDSKIALDFHRLRNSNPALFQSKYINYMWYGGLGFKNFFGTAVDLSEALTLQIDGNEKPLHKVQALVFLNIPSIYGGASLWDESKENQKNKKQYINDKRIEVFGIKNATHLALLQSPGQVTGGGKFLGDGGHIRVTVKQNLPAQIDGEPFILDKCQFVISHFNQATLIYNPKSKYKKTLIQV